MRLHPLAGGLLAALLASAPLHAALPTYAAPQLQARTNLLVNDEGWNLPPGSSFNSITASINENGTVAFPVQVVPIDGNLSDTGVGIWSGANGVGGIVQTHRAPAEFISDRVGINRDGKIVYYTHGDAYRLWIYDPAAAASAPVNTLPITPNSFNGQTINADGVIGYRAGLPGGSGLASTGAGSSVLHIVDNGIDPGSPYSYIYTPSMNDSRRIAAKVSVGPPGNFSKDEIRVFDTGGAYETLAVDTDTDPTSPFVAFDNTVSMNAIGEVAVVVRLAAGNQRAVYRLTPTGAGVQATPIARVDPAGPILELDAFAPVINVHGMVAFRARDAQGQAIYVGDGENLLRIAGKGDRVQTDLGTGQLGQHDTSPVFSGAPGLNDNGDVVFVAGLHPDGNNQIEWGSGVFVAAVAGDERIFRDGFDDELP